MAQQHNKFIVIMTALAAQMIAFAGTASGQGVLKFDGWDDFIEQSKKGFSCKQYFNTTPEEYPKSYRVLCDGEEVSKKLHLVENFSNIRYVGNGIICGIDQKHPESGEFPRLMVETPEGLETHNHYSNILYVSNNSSYAYKRQALRTKTVDFLSVNLSACKPQALIS